MCGHAFPRRDHRMASRCCRDSRDQRFLLDGPVSQSAKFPVGQHTLLSLYTHGSLHAIAEPLPKVLEEMSALLGHVVSIQAVEEKLDVPACFEVSLPCSRTDVVSFCAHDRWAVTRPIAPLEHLKLEALDVDLEEVNVSSDVLAKDAPKRDNLDFIVHMGKRTVVLFWPQSRQTPTFRVLAERERAAARSNRHIEVQLVRPRSHQRFVRSGHGFDVDPTPTGEVEQLGHRVDVRVVSSDVDVEPSLNAR